MESERIVKYGIEYARSDRANCRLCGHKIDQEVLRVAGLVQAPNSERLIEKWYHAECGFKAIFYHGVKTGVLKGPSDIAGIERINQWHKEQVVSWLNATINKVRAEMYAGQSHLELGLVTASESEDDDSSAWSDYEDEEEEHGYEEEDDSDESVSLDDSDYESASTTSASSEFGRMRLDSE
jgi:hypothetical protein